MKKQWIATAIILIGIGIIGLAFNKFALGDNTTKNIEKSWTFDANTLNNITIIGTSNNLDVEFVQSDSDTGSIVVSGNTDKATVDQINKASIVNNNYELDLTTAFKLQFFSFNFEDSKIHITVSLPKDHVLETVYIDTNSGNLNAEHILVQQATITTKSGNLNVAAIQAKQAAVTTNSGNLKAEDLKAETISLTTKSGNLNADNITGTLQASANSGNIKMTNASGHVTAESSSGNITISQSTVQGADVNASSGNVTFTVAEGFSGFYELRSNSGTIKAPDSIGTSSDMIKINTKSGNIKVK
ncbi:MAG TPA: DUF4097 domain-containing protein [Candidatus Paenibacillus intestinavium]|nr:DUF4097 domain-containing protein [Candidatus Paenibacillus intestinavium]